MSQETILVIDDEQAQREALAGHLLKQGYKVLVGEDGTSGLELFAHNQVDLILTDFRMHGMDGLSVLQQARRLNPEVEVVLLTAYGTIDGAVEAMREGACHYLEKPIELDELDQVVQAALEHHHLVSENRLLKTKLEEGHGLTGIISVDPAMEQALNVVARAASSRTTVLIHGESGTGKELVAQAIHTASPRQGKAFVAFNCAALSQNLIESELFGHEKGSFTGADRQRLGRFEQADGGTLFIDEVAEIPVELQVKLLRVLQERVIERVGGDTPRKVDVRLLSATNQNLEEMVARGRFRADLFYRLNVVEVHLPPLRERRQDIPVLIDYFLRRYNDENGKDISEVSREAMDLLMRYNYPGNVRELQNMIERAVVMTRNSVITRADLAVEVQAGAQVPATQAEGAGLSDQVEALEKAAIERALEQTEGIQSQAAELLGLTERNLRYKLRKYGFK
ncbi:MAG: two-component system response regulator [Gemmatimonadetes bacterium]|nr:two-component system response regulator [Gemmatimonadota bacterium]